jgi:hypothetical protein
MEIYSDSSIHFLEVFVIRKETKLVTKVYRNPPTLVDISINSKHSHAVDG